MTRAQCLIHRGGQILMVKHRLSGEEWWCLPGGGVEAQETPAQAALRELAEECRVHGKIVRQIGQAIDAEGVEIDTFLVDIGSQQSSIGNDPEFDLQEQVLSDMRWLTLAEIPERDRAYLWAAGLMSIPQFLDEISHWGDTISYPVE
jgi:8-oxo-dGTP diphosphatase